MLGHQHLTSKSSQSLQEILYIETLRGEGGPSSSNTLQF